MLDKVNKVFLYTYIMKSKWFIARTSNGNIYANNTKFEMKTRLQGLGSCRYKDASAVLTPLSMSALYNGMRRVVWYFAPVPDSTSCVF